MRDRPHALYKFYDAAGDLLYVGITLDPGNRWKQHRDDKTWWREVANVTIEAHPDRHSVLEAERAAIVSEQPRYNVVHNRGATRPLPVGPRRATVAEHQPYDSATNEWEFQTLRSGYERVTDLHLAWEVNGTAMSDDWYPHEVDAHTLLQLWAKRYGAPTVPIYWSVHPVYETAPFQTGFRWDDGRNFLTYYTWPTNVHTGERLNFNRLPVLDGEWHETLSTKGGFFQQATGWKPTALQATVDVENTFAAAGVPYMTPAPTTRVAPVRAQLAARRDEESDA